MKKFALLGCLAAIIVCIVLSVGGIADMGTPDSAYLRIHIRADSNEAAAQAVKYEVRDAVVRLLTPAVAECDTKEAAMERLRKELPAIEKAALQVLRERGYSYGVRASLRREQFPTRVYENVTLAAGVYDALILELGSGKGDNWWCVVYPPLCFTSGGGSVVYRSKIAEIVKKFFERA